jgi:hypothetical protein
MDLHRYLMRGTGFYDWMIRTGPGANLEQAMANLEPDKPAPALRPLPTVNLLDGTDDQYVDALIEEALPHDRAPFRRYMADRPLGLGIITAVSSICPLVTRFFPPSFIARQLTLSQGPGSSRTTLLSVAGLAMQHSIGKIFCSGPSGTAVNKLAYRLNDVTASVCGRYNNGKEKGDPSRARRKLVVRGFNIAHETQAVWKMLQHPDRDPALSNRAAWILPLSVAYWFLAVLWSKAKGIKELDEDDSEALHQMRQDLEKRADFKKLRALATGEMTWAEWAALKDGVKIVPILDKIVCSADLLCTTPAMSAQDKSPYLWYKYEIAMGVLINEAANMNRADYACVAGNCLLPCIMGGDPKQQRPVVMTGMAKDGLGHFHHRLAKDGAISPLLFFQTSGIPVYRLG